jgi:hypothetical protein
MRWKIIAVNSIIVLLVGVLSYALLRAGLGDLASNPTQLKAEAERALAAANSKLELDAVRTERWLATMANEKASREVFKAGTVSARQEEATEYSNRLLSAAVGHPVFFQMTPTLVAVVDANGISLGRNGTNLGRGEDLAAGHPSLKAAAAQGVTVTDVWADAKTSELMSVSYAPIRDDDRKVLGLLLVGTPLNDGRLQRTAELTSGRGLILGIPAGANIDLKANPPTSRRTCCRPSGKVRSKTPCCHRGERSWRVRRERSGRRPSLPPPQRLWRRQACGARRRQSGEPHREHQRPASGPCSRDGPRRPPGVPGGFLPGNYISRPIEELKKACSPSSTARRTCASKSSTPSCGASSFA